jgi:hypothetical protein
LDATPPPLKS